MDKYSGCHASRNDRIRTQTNSLRKVKNTFALQFKKRRNSMCYKHCASAIWFLVVFSFFEKTTYCCRARRLSVRPSVCLSVRPSVEIISFCGNSLSNRPIELKIGLHVREGVVHVRKA